MEIKSADDFDLFRRLDEIDGELQDFHILAYQLLAYQCDLLYKEQDSLKAELQQRGYMEKYLYEDNKRNGNRIK